jgi:hypothetical protein
MFEPECVYRITGTKDGHRTSAMRQTRTGAQCAAQGLIARGFQHVDIRIAYTDDWESVPIEGVS